MAFVYRTIVNRALEHGEVDGNLAMVEQLYEETLAARDTAVLNSSTYTSTVAGLAATSDGEFFTTPGTGSEYLRLYRNDSGVATLVSTYVNYEVSGTGIIQDGHYLSWAFTRSGGTAEQPAEVVYSEGAQRVRVTLTWGTSGGGDGNVISAVYEYSDNSGVSYSPEGTKTISYDAAGNVVSTTWS